MKRILHIENLDCPVCAEALQSDLQKVKGVQSVLVDYVTQTITLELETENSLPKVIKIVNNFEEVRVLDGGMVELKKESRVKEWLQIGLSALLFVLGVVFSNVLKFDAAKYIAYALYDGAYLTVGYSVLISTVKNIAKGRVFDENFLMTIASIGAVALGEIMEGVVVMFLYQLGELLQSIAVGSSRRSVTKLMELKSERAVLLVNGEQKEVAPEDLKVGDIALVKTGEKTPTDGELLAENAVLDVKSLTGETEWKDVKKGEEVLSGSINVGAAYEMRVLRPYADSAVGKILEMVENAASGKAKPEKFIAKFSRYYTPIVCLFAVLMALVAPLIGGLVAEGRLYFYDFPRFAQSALTFLVISCPCALVISVPLTYFSGIGACAKMGILVTGATYLDKLAKAEIFAFDKTGTLTEGEFSIRSVRGEAMTLPLIAAVEKASAHPIAKAFASVETRFYAENIVEITGKGLQGSVEGESVLVGSPRFLAEEGVKLPALDSAYTLVCVAKEGKYLGCVEIGDNLRKNAKESLSALQKLGVSRAVMLTGDNEERAKSIANEVGMYELNAELLPDAKLKQAEKLKKEGTLVYVGDGVNDAPVMMTADCSISMGKLGSAAAVDASDFVLVSDDLKALPIALSIAKKTRKIVLQNIWFSISMKVSFMVLGAMGVLPLWLAVFADVGIMLLAVLNSFRVRL